MPRVSLSPTAVSRDGKTVWPSPATTCPRHHSWESQASCRSSVMTVRCARSDLSSDGWSSCSWLRSHYAIPENTYCRMSWRFACGRGPCALLRRSPPSRSGCSICWPKDARTSANWVIGVVGLYLVMTTALGFGAAALVGRDTIIAANKAGNSAAPLLALQLGGGPETLGGEILVAFISAVTFATILAVVAGLIIAAATNIAHDVYTHVIKVGVSSEKAEVKVAKLSTIAVGVAAIALALATKSLNVAFLVGLAFAVAASANLPVILYSLYWKRFNTTGAVSALIAGVVSAAGLVLVGPAVIGPKGLVLTDVQPLISLINPGIISIPIGFFSGWLGTVLTARELISEERFTMLQVRALTGFGSEQSAKSHWSIS